MPLAEEVFFEAHVGDDTAQAQLFQLLQALIDPGFAAQMLCILQHAVHAVHDLQRAIFITRIGKCLCIKYAHSIACHSHECILTPRMPNLRIKRPVKIDGLLTGIPILKDFLGRCFFQRRQPGLPL